MDPENQTPEGNLAPQVQNPAPVTAPAADARVAQLEAELKATKEREDKARGYAIALTQRISAMESQPRQVEPQLSPEQRQQAIQQQLVEDPEGTLDAHFQQRIAPMMQSQHQMLATFGKNQFLQKVGQEEWKKYGPEVEQFVANLPNAHETMAQPGAWDEAYKYVRMNHIDDIIAERLRAAQEEQVRKTLPEGGGANGAGPSATTRAMSDLERHMAKEFGMSEDEWRNYGNPNLTAPVMPQEN